jgi:hypothetical protein
MPPATYLTWIALVPVCSFAVFALGGPPLLTDDPGTPGNRNWEINIASTQFFSPGENEVETPLLDINYGLGDRIQLKYEVPYLLDQDEGEPYRSGLGNSLLGVKWRFYQQNGWNISTYPQVEVNNPENSLPRGLVDRGPRFLLPVEITKVFGPVELTSKADTGGPKRMRAATKGFSVWRWVTSSQRDSRGYRKSTMTWSREGRHAPPRSILVDATSFMRGCSSSSWPGAAS